MAQRVLDRQKEEEECTFAPKTNVSSNNQIASKYMSRLSDSQEKRVGYDVSGDGTGKNLMHQDFQQSNQANFLGSYRGGDPML